VPDLVSRTAGPGMAGRRCEGCGAMMPPRTHRQARPSDGLMVCQSCLLSDVAPRPATAARTTRYRMTPEELAGHLRVGHGWSEEEIGSHHPRDLHPLHVGLHEAGELYDWAPKPRHNHVTLSVVESLQAVAHESSDDLEIMHCPWCGSGQVAAQSDGSIECGYCQRVFTVRLQPAFPAMPQSIDGQPYPPGQPGADPGMPGDEVPGQLPAGTEELPPGAEDGEQEPDEEEDDVPAFLKGSLRTSTGAELGLDSYLRHLAVVESGYDEAVLTQVREDSAR
jgi:hypothetical protein